MKYHTISYHIITFFHLAYIFSIESDKNGPNEISMHITTSIRPCGSAVGIWINIQRSVIKKPNLPIYNAAVQVLLKHVEFQNLHDLISNFQNCQYISPAVSRFCWLWLVFLQGVHWQQGCRQSQVLWSYWHYIKYIKPSKFVSYISFETPSNSAHTVSSSWTVVLKPAFIAMLWKKDIKWHRFRKENEGLGGLPMVYCGPVNSEINFHFIAVSKDLFWLLNTWLLHGTPWTNPARPVEQTYPMLLLCYSQFILISDFSHLLRVG